MSSSASALLLSLARLAAVGKPIASLLCPAACACDDGTESRLSSVVSKAPRLLILLALFGEPAPRWRWCLAPVLVCIVVVVGVAGAVCCCCCCGLGTASVF